MFGRKKPKNAKQTAAGAATAGAASTSSVPAARATSGSRAPEAPATPSSDGPHDRSTITDVPGYYTGIGFGHIDLGSLVIGVPQGRELSVAMDPAGQPEFHVVTAVSRVIPRAFAAPKSAGQWRTMVDDMRGQLEKQGGDVTVVDGPWGRELVAHLPNAVFRAVGVDGHRWTAEVRIMSAPENAEQAAEEGREVLRHLLVHRGDGPMPVREPLALTIPDEIQAAINQARAQLAAQQQAQAFQQQMAAGQAAQQAAQPAPGQPAQAAPAQPAGDQATEGQAAAPGAGAAPSAPPQRDTGAMDRLRGSDDL